MQKKRTFENLNNEGNKDNEQQPAKCQRTIPARIEAKVLDFNSITFPRNKSNLLGEGGNGEVYKGELTIDKSTKVVAVKVVKFKNDENKKCIIREIK